jgi:hypothetical protein
MTETTGKGLQEACKNYKIFYSSGGTKVTGFIGKREYNEIRAQIKREDPKAIITEIKK